MCDQVMHVNFNLNVLYAVFNLDPIFVHEFCTYVTEISWRKSVLPFQNICF